MKLKRLVKHRKNIKHGKRYKLHQILFVSAFLFLLSAYFIGVMNKNVKPTVEALAEARARYLASTSINNAVIQSLEDVAYEDLVEVHRAYQDPKGKDKGQQNQEYGHVTSLNARVAVMNKMAANLTKMVNEELRAMENMDTNIKVPLSTVFGEQIFANFGPMIPIHIYPVGSANVTFFTEFSQAGINQTRHRIYLKIIVDVRMVTPILVSHQDAVELMIPVAETVIVGPIPQNYVNTTPTDVLDVMPDSGVLK